MSLGKTPSPTLGALLRGLREQNGWTLKEMSERAGIPLSTLSKIEHDRLTLTYDKLQDLSRRLDIKLSELFSGESISPASSAVMARRSIGTLKNAVRVTTPNYDYYYMCPDLKKKRIIPITIRTRVKSLAEFGDLISHEGEEYIYVLSGKLVVHTEFYEPVTLSPGESVYIDSKMGHAFVAGEGCDEAVMINTCSADHEDLMHSLIAQAESTTVTLAAAQ